MKKILFVNSSLTSGGSEKVMTLLANEFSKKGHDVYMVLLREIEEETYKLAPKVKCLKFKYGTKNKIIIALKRIYKLRKVLKKEKYDYVISFMHDINTQVLISNIGLNNKIIVSERANPQTRKISKFMKKVEDYMYKKSHRIVFQTEDVKNMYDEKIKRKSVVIPNPVDSNIMKPYKGERENTIVGVGRLTEQKNFIMLIDAFEMFLKKHENFILKIYGEGYLRNELEEYIKEKKLNEKVELPGYVENVTEKVRTSAMYVSSSDYEGISNSMIEALAMGVPTICTDCPVGGAAMMIENNKNGILIPLNDRKSLFDAMNKIVDDRTFTKNISNESVKIKETYSISKIADKWLDICEG